MNSHHNQTIAVFLSLTTCLLFGFLANETLAVQSRQTIKNDNAADANDLKVEFQEGGGKVTKVKIGDVPGAVDTDGHGASFAQGTISAAGGGGKLNLDYTVDPKTFLEFRGATSMWTHDGMNIGKVTLVGDPMSLAFNPLPGGATGAVATFVNNDPFSITYSNIQLVANNNLANFNIDSFLIPTGTLVGGLPSTINVDPGNSVTLSFGPINPSTYQLAIAMVSQTGTTDFFTVASADAVPEPSTWLLLASGVIALGIMRARRSCAKRVY
jgi:hypothetical protein